MNSPERVPASPHWPVNLETSIDLGYRGVFFLPQAPFRRLPPLVPSILAAPSRGVARSRIGGNSRRPLRRFFKTLSFGLLAERFSWAGKQCRFERRDDVSFCLPRRSFQKHFSWL